MWQFDYLKAGWGLWIAPHKLPGKHLKKQKKARPKQVILSLMVLWWTLCLYFFPCTEMKPKYAGYKHCWLTGVIWSQTRHYWLGSGIFDLYYSQPPGGRSRCPRFTLCHLLRCIRKTQDTTQKKMTAIQYDDWCIHKMLRLSNGHWEFLEIRLRPDIPGYPGVTMFSQKRHFSLPALHATQKCNVYFPT